MKIEVKNSASPIAFATKGGGSWQVWDRFITIDGKDAYHIGNVCGTCPFFFQRLDGANKSLDAQSFQEELSQGISEFTDAHASILAELLPNGEYEASLQFRVPRLVTPGTTADYYYEEQVALWGTDKATGPHDPRTRYYRGSDQPLGGGAHLFEFFLPMFPEDRLDMSRVEEFENLMREGRLPTALAISVLDVKQPADWVGDPEVTSHWCLAHYIIDGHHKVFAAARTGQPVGVVSALAVGQGLSGPEEHAKLGIALAGARRRLV